MTFGSSKVSKNDFVGSTEYFLLDPSKLVSMKFILKQESVNKLISLDQLDFVSPSVSLHQLWLVFSGHLSHCTIFGIFSFVSSSASLHHLWYDFLCLAICYIALFSMLCSPLSWHLFHASSVVCSHLSHICFFAPSVMVSFVSPSVTLHFFR